MSRQPARDEPRGRLLAAIPLTEHRRELAGVPTAVLEGGEGPPMILLHSAGEFAAVWLRVIPELMRTHRLIVPDLPGHGASEITGDPPDAEAVFTWLDELVTQTCPEPPVIVGHLLGGAIAARFAADNSSRLAHLVLVDTMGLARYRPTLSFALPMMAFIAHPTERSRDRMFNRCFLDYDGVAEQLGELQDWLGDYAVDRARQPGLKATLKRLMPRLAMPAIPDADLARITVRTTLIHGRHDLQVRLSVAEAASTRYGWPLHVIDGARDDPAFEQPEAFLDALHAAVGTSTQPETP